MHCLWYSKLPTISKPLLTVWHRRVSPCPYSNCSLLYMDIFFNLVLSTNASTFPEPAQNSGNLGVIQVIFKRNDSGIFHFQIILQLKMLFFFIQFRETKLQSYSPPILIPSCFLLVKWNYNKKYAESVFEEFHCQISENFGLHFRNFSFELWKHWWVLSNEYNGVQVYRF